MISTGGFDILRRDIADRLYSIVIKRFHKEQPERELTNSEMSSIWYEIYGKLCRGELASWQVIVFAFRF